MKKVFTLILALAFGFGLKAQTSATQAIDFTVTDVHGTEVHLFDILDNGQYVLIDFFYTTCPACIQSIPYMVQSYSNFGCNMHDVFYMEVDHGDSQASCLTWVNNYGVEYPTIAGADGGNSICSQYGIGYYPTVILIAPNHQVVIQDLWPISNVQSIINALQAQGVQQHDCDTPVVYDPQVALSIDEVTENSITATFTPNEDCASYYYLCATEAELTEWVAELGQDLPAIMQEHGVVETNTLTNFFDGLIPETEYAVAVLPVDPDGNYGEPSYEIVTTLPLPVVYDETLTFSMDTVNLVDNQYETYWVTIYNNTAEDAIVTNICDEFGWLAFNMDGEDIYCNNPIEITIPQGESKELGITINVVAKGIVSDIVTLTSNLPDASFVVVLEEPWSVNDNTSSISLFPNPANESVTLMGENLGMVHVFNVLGQKVDEFEASGSEIRINTTSYENGVYVVKAGEQTMRFVVKH